jgi:hypothetical protein
MATIRTPAFHSSPRASSQSVTVFVVRPAVCPSRPAGPARSTKLVSKRSSPTHLPLSASFVHRGRPRRVSSIPSTSTRAGSVSTASARAT